MTLIICIAAWYIIGIACDVLYTIKHDDYYKNDIISSLIIGIAGPLVLPIYWWINDLFSPRQGTPIFKKKLNKK